MTEAEWDACADATPMLKFLLARGTLGQRKPHLLTQAHRRFHDSRYGKSSQLSERYVQAAYCGMIRDVFGNPFRPPPCIDSTWLTWNDGMVPKLAQLIYDERAFGRLPLLADALEDAGCADSAILEHCRQPGEHVRGCWVVDLLLGKK